MAVKFRDKFSSGFTLIELLAVISIISFLTTLAVVPIRGAVKRAGVSKGLQYSQSLYNALGIDITGFWNFDEGSGNMIIDSSGYGNNGTIFGANYIADTPHHVIKQGEGRYALSFDGVDDYAQIPHNSSLEPPNSGGTISLWIKFDPSVDLGQTHKMGILRKSVHGNWMARGGYELFLFQYAPSDPHVLAVDLGSENNTDTLYDTTSITNDQWHYITVMWDTNNLSLFINGRLSSVIPRTKTLVWSWNQPLIIGHILGFYGSSQYRMHGIVDELRIYRQSLTSVQINKHYVESASRHGIALNN